MNYDVGDKTYRYVYNYSAFLTMSLRPHDFEITYTASWEFPAQVYIK